MEELLTASSYGVRSHRQENTGSITEWSITLTGTKIPALQYFVL